MAAVVMRSAELSQAPPSPAHRGLDMVFYSAPSSPRSAPEEEDREFEFNFSSGHLVVDGPALLAADELFHAGKILPLKPTPAHHSPSSNKRSHGFLDPPARGRPTNPNTANPRRGMSRSLSPLRVSEFALHQQQQQEQMQQQPSSSRGGYKRWKLKDLLLFRSASEGSRPLPNTSVFNDSKRFSAAPNRALPDHFNRRTSLPYKFGLLSCLGFHLSSSSSSSSSSRFQHFSTGFGYDLPR